METDSYYGQIMKITFLDKRITDITPEDIEALKNSPVKVSYIDVTVDAAKLYNDRQIMDEVCIELSKQLGFSVSHEGAVREWFSETIKDPRTESGMSGMKNIIFEIFWE